MTTIRVTQTKEVKLTAENEIEILNAEFDGRYGDNEFDVGDAVRFISNGKPKQLEFMGGDHIGKPGIVTQIGQENSVKVLAITLDGDFFEVWTDGRNVELAR
jgi:hypothetical protein